MRTVFIGTSEFAAAVLEGLAQSEHRPVLVLSRPDRPRGRGRRLAAPPVAQAARRQGIAVEQPQQINDPGVCALIERAATGEGASAAHAARQRVEGAPGGESGAAHVGRERVEGAPAGEGGDRVCLGAGSERVALVVCAFGALIREPLLSAYPLLNVHPSLLPRWRGAAPIERAIMAGDTQTGVSIMRLTEGLDSGPVCAAATEGIGPQDTYGSLAARLQRLGGELLVGVLDDWERGRPPRFVEQAETGATYAEKISPQERLLDPTRPAVALERQVRALHPHIGARLLRADGTPLGVARAALAKDGSPDLPVGAMVASDGCLLYGTGEGSLELLEVQPPSGRPMDAASYLRGHGLPGA